ncbi:MarR family transcriptional regulator [Actinoplanes sp. NBRC 103695]|uniref:MarR family winged helix-turn-helix transcriptional regulator n=1 Tax=Actinoplanes sp. NBRC 103695 TaxID=3032202 RepID=UPI0024A0CF0F|nr:MarR family transcriptional regulator [Actinoplanes sp. NBRC 103695]GLY97661.1 MarR family transcriptional regulator [Actinoplanes sp. NBRC 103695]
MADDVLGTIETQVAMLMRLGEATRRATDLKPHRALDRSAYVILRHLEAAGPLNVSALADRLNLDGSTVTRQVTSLENDALVERRRDPNDGRGTVIAATERGLEQMEAVRVARRGVYDRVLQEWNADERAALAGALERFNASVEAYMRAPRP